jgi:hypothetical protein
MGEPTIAPARTHRAAEPAATAAVNVRRPSRPDQPSPSVVVITGMHRSGTSLMASAFQRAGVHIGDRLFGSAPGNRRGHFEDVEFHEFHEGVLRRIGKNFLSVTPADLAAMTPDDVERAEALIGRRRERRLWGWKDPRTCSFLQFWHPLLPDACYVFVYRHPLEVVLSLHRRAGYPEDVEDSLLALEAWRVHNQAILDFHRQHRDRCVLGHVGAMVRDISGTLELCAKRFRLDLAGDGASALYRPAELAQRILPHDVLAEFERMAPSVARLYRSLERAADLPEPEVLPVIAGCDRSLADAPDGHRRGDGTSREDFELLLTRLEPRAVLAGKRALDELRRRQLDSIGARCRDLEVQLAGRGAALRGTEPDAAVRPLRARLMAFYLPQFHPIPENDGWWGKGFTEWTNVAKARPMFRGHYQPHLPGELGFYDLRLPEARLAQAELAKAHGIEGFCYWHYWFEGTRLLGGPLAEMLTSGLPDLGFCLAWANESWSRRWLGEERDLIQKQGYSPEDDVNHARWLQSAFGDHRYIRVQGRPLFLVYRPLDLPDPRRTTEVFRDSCVRHGLPEPYLLGINAHCPHVDCRTLGFDGTVDFEPQLGVLPGFLHDGRGMSKLLRNLNFGIVDSRLKVYDYVTARRLMAERTRDFPVYPAIFVGWDNTPRRGPDSIVIVNSGPDDFASGLDELIRSASHKPYDDRLVFINAWNEWAEGNHLEPDARYGRRYLEAVRRVNGPEASRSDR